MKKDKVVVWKKKEYSKKKTKALKFLILSIFLLPFFTYMLVIGSHSSSLINNTFKICLVIGEIVSLIIFISSLFLIVKEKDSRVLKYKTWFKVVLGIFLFFYLGLSTFFIFLLYGPNKRFKDWLIPTAMETMRHQYLAKWFYNADDINKVLKSNELVEVKENTNPELVMIVKPQKRTIYQNEFEKEILERDKDQLYKFISIERRKSRNNLLKGYLVAIYDPKKVKLFVPDLSSHRGLRLEEIYKKYNYPVIMNAGGFADPGGIGLGRAKDAHGPVIKDGKKVTNNGRYSLGRGGIIGFNKENKLILSRMTIDEAIRAGIRDAVDFGPYLIVNGKPSFQKGSGSGGLANRTVIGQRSDGIVLFLVMDGRRWGSVPGADYGDLVEIMSDYGAINAANLDGGTSSGLIYEGELKNVIINMYGQRLARTRPMANAWIVEP